MRIGLVGCGTLGRRLGNRLLRGGHDLEIHDRNPTHAAPLLDCGARWAENPTDLAGNEVIVSALPFQKDVESVVLGEDGIWAAAARGTVHLETSTLGLACVRGLAKTAASQGIRFLDSPVSRGAVKETGPEIVLWVGGNADDYDLARPVMETMADRILYCGSIGLGQVTKLVNNLITHSLTVILGEALAVGVGAGASLDLLRAALHLGTAQNRLLDEMLPATVFRGDWKPGLRLSMAEKDLRLAAELATEVGVELTTIDPMRSVYRRASERGWEELSAHAVLRLVEESSGVVLRSAIFESLPDIGSEDDATSEVSR